MWTLYYLIVIVTFVVLPLLGFFAIPRYMALLSGSFRYTFPLNVLLMPQVALSIFEPVPYAEPLWSIGVEEQFYLLWPALLKHFRKFLRLTIVIALVVILFRQLVFWLAEANRSSPTLKYWNYLVSYLYFT